jgi:hypothetical protein
MEAIRNFHNITPPRENIPGIPLVETQISPSIPPTRPCVTAPYNNINKRSTISNTTSILNNALEAMRLVTES